MNRNNITMCRDARTVNRGFRTFDTPLQPVQSMESRGDFKTTHQQDFGTGSKPTHTMQRMIKEGLVPPSGGRASGPKAGGIDVEDSSSAFDANGDYRRKATSITKVDRHKDGIFSDD